MAPQFIVAKLNLPGNVETFYLRSARKLIIFKYSLKHRKLIFIDA